MSLFCFHNRSFVLTKGAFIFWLLAGIFFNESQAASLEELLPQLAERTFPAKQAALDSLATSNDERVPAILTALAQGELYLRSVNPIIVIGQPSTPGNLRLIDPLTQRDLGEVGASSSKKITLNNKMRTTLRLALAVWHLNDANPTIRLAAAREMLGENNPTVLQALQNQLARESVVAVRNILVIALALPQLTADDAVNRLKAISVLANNLYPEARNALVPLAESDPDPSVKSAAVKALSSIDRQLTWSNRLETLFFGLSLGSVLVLAAIGLAITFGVMGVINMAHGELIMIGAYTTYLVQTALPSWLDYSILLAIPAAFIVSALFGILIERTVIRFLYGRPLETLLATFGISLILQQLVRTFISAQNVVVQNPGWMSGAWPINPALALTYSRLYILIFALAVFVALLLVLRRTNLGLAVRAVSQNRAMARAMGVRSARVDVLTFGLGSGVAGVAGVALSQLTNVGPNMGQAYIIDSFMVVVFGGVGNLWGTLVAGLSLGVANKIMEPWAGAVLAKILVLVFIILFIQKRPRGLFPPRGRAAEG